MDPHPSQEPATDAIDAELEFHFAEMVDALVERGWTAAHALAEAERRFGDRGRYRRALEKIHEHGRDRR
ncbi:MAG: permease prefix domain 1-containing protein, partial [Steroidobacteraceae bacterium]